MNGLLSSCKERWCIEMVCALRSAVLLVAFSIVGCSRQQSQPKEITLATTTSTQDSGLLEVLVPAFQRQTGIKVKVVAVGSGQALELGRRGDADVVLSHSPDAEKRFIEEGWGTERLAVMHNDFIIVGPADDPAGIKGKTTAVDAFKSIADNRLPFVSRGDESGTHQMERTIWKEAGVDPKGGWYIRAGTSMAQALRMANEKIAYLLCDRSTYLALKKELELVVLLEGDDRLLNRYSVITVNKARHPHVHHEEANRFARFLLSPEGQKMIGAFGVDRFGQPLFVPDAELDDPNDDRSYNAAHLQHESNRE